MLSNELAMAYNWQGRDKKSFEKLKECVSIIQGINKNLKQNSLGNSYKQIS